MKKAVTVLLIFLMLMLSACASQTPALQAPTATPHPPTDTPISIRRRRTPTPVVPSPTPSPFAVRATDTPTAGPAFPNSSSPYTITAVYTQDGGSERADGETYTAANADQSAVYVKNSGKLTLTNAAITTSGNTSSQDNSSFHGLNAAMLAAGGSSINLSDSTIATSGNGANGAFATDAGSSVTLSNVAIQASADGAHGVMATNGGSLTLTNVDITTAGDNSGAIATDRGGGTINVTGGTVITSGQNSPDIYSTGAVSVRGGTMRATGAEAAVIEGGNSITLTNTSLFSTMRKWGVMIYQSMSGDVQSTQSTQSTQGTQEAQGVFTMTGGSLSYDSTSGPLFYVTNATAVIKLKSAVISSASGLLLKASAGNWGASGSNGGDVIFTADSQTLTGDLVADNLSSITLTLQKDSIWTGTINADHTAKSTHLTMDATTSWYMTGDAYLTCLTDPGEIYDTIVANITGNGHTVYYEASACPNLHGRTYPLLAGGSLKPAD